MGLMGIRTPGKNRPCLCGLLSATKSIGSDPIPEELRRIVPLAAVPYAAIRLPARFNSRRRLLSCF